MSSRSSIQQPYRCGGHVLDRYERGLPRQVSYKLTVIDVQSLFVYITRNSLLKNTSFPPSSRSFSFLKSPCLPCTLTNYFPLSPTLAPISYLKSFLHLLPFPSHSPHLLPLILPFFSFLSLTFPSSSSLSLTHIFLRAHPRHLVSIQFHFFLSFTPLISITSSTLLYLLFFLPSFSLPLFKSPSNRLHSPSFHLISQLFHLLSTTEHLLPSFLSPSQAYSSSTFYLFP